MLRRDRMFAGSLSGSTPTFCGVSGFVVASVVGFFGGVAGLASATVGVRSSTFAPGCSSGVDAHPTSRPTAANIVIHRFICRSCSNVPLIAETLLPRLFYERAPRRLAYVACAFAEALLHASVA